ncbi:hypothetical protein Ciccas_014449, partial [Cichlidogyrus casuarinus]
MTFLLQSCGWLAFAVGTLRHGDQFRAVLLHNVIDLLQSYEFTKQHLATVITSLEQKHHFYTNPPLPPTPEQNQSWFTKITAYDHHEDPEWYPTLSYVGFFMAAGCLMIAVRMPAQVIKRIYVYKPMSSMFRGGTSSTEVASELFSDLNLELTSKLQFETYGLLSS